MRWFRIRCRSWSISSRPSYIVSCSLISASSYLRISLSVPRGKPAILWNKEINPPDPLTLLVIDSLAAPQNFRNRPHVPPTSSRHRFEPRIQVREWSLVGAPKKGKKTCWWCRTLTTNTIITTIDVHIVLINKQCYIRLRIYSRKQKFGIHSHCNFSAKINTYCTRRWKPLSLLEFLGSQAQM